MGATAPDPNQDPVIRQYRDQIAALDREVLAALNQRLALVRQLRDYKASAGLEFHDPAQEERLLAALAQANAGPLSEQGLRAIFGAIVAWGKR